MKTIFISICLIFIITIALVKSNPTESDLQNFIKEEIIEESRKTNRIMGWVGKIIADPASWFVTLNVERENYFIFSIYTIPGMDCDRKLFGIATIIFPINSCNPAYSN